MADKHAECAPNEECSTSDALHAPERHGRRADIDDSENHGHEEGVLDGTGGLQEGRRVVEDKVDTGPLLHHLERCTEDGLAEVRVALPDAAREAVGPGAPVAGVGDRLLLEFVVGNDLRQLVFDVLAVGGLATEAGEGIACALDVTLLDEVTGGVWEEEETGSEDEAPRKLDGDGDAVGASVGAVLGERMAGGWDARKELRITVGRWLGRGLAREGALCRICCTRRDVGCRERARAMRMRRVRAGGESRCVGPVVGDAMVCMRGRRQRDARTRGTRRVRIPG